jgi:hypothetical protein
MLLAFTLSMPQRSSWNGRWSGEDKPYVVVKNVSNSQKYQGKYKKIVETGYFSYSFGDGWVARINVGVVDAKECAKLRRSSAVFFCGYEWMIKSICEIGSIIAPSEQGKIN